jgi:hypothetical protein
MQGRTGPFFVSLSVVGPRTGAGSKPPPRGYLYPSAHRTWAQAPIDHAHAIHCAIYSLSPNRLCSSIGYVAKPHGGLCSNSACLPASRLPASRLVSLEPGPHPPMSCSKLRRRRRDGGSCIRNSCSSLGVLPGSPVFTALRGMIGAFATEGCRRQI